MLEEDHEEKNSTENNPEDISSDHGEKWLISSLISKIIESQEFIQRRDLFQNLFFKKIQVRIFKI